MEIKLVYTTSAQLNNLPVIDGQVTVLTDKTAFYYDMNGSRYSFIDKVPADLGFGYGTCSTATSTAAKTSSITGYSLATGGLVAIKFDNAVDANATLNISSKGAKPIYYKGQAVTAGIINANSTALMMYDGTNYNIVSVDDDIIDDSQLSTGSTYSSQKIEDTYINQNAIEERTASTSFESYSGGLLSSLKVSLSPNQDLHGYENPWVGGSRKNKFEVTATTATEQGVLFNINSDGTITTTRQSASSNNASIIMGDFTLPVGSYKINGANNASNGGYFTLRKASDNTFIANIESSGYDLNVSDATFEYRLTCVVQSSVSPTGDYTTVKPMIRLATESDPTFAPYSNICPISGHTQVEVDVSDGQTTQEQVTVNLGGTYYSGTLDVVSGVLTVDSAFIASYNGETLPSTWISDRDVYAVGTTPTTGAEVCYKLATPQSIQLSPTMVKALVGENHLSAPLEGQEITESKYRELFTWDEVEEIAQKIADSKIDNIYTSYNTTFSSAFTEARYVKKIYGAPVLTALQIVLSGAPSITFNHQLIFSDSQTCCELIQFGSGARIEITDVAISQGSVTFTFDSPLTKAIGFRCRITNDFVS